MISSRQSDVGTTMDSRRLVLAGCGNRPVMFLHGLFGTPEHWRFIMTELAEDYRVVAPQFPIDPLPERRAKGIRTIDELTDYVADIIFDLDLPPMVLCGNSLGGLIAIEICSRYPERVAGLVLAGSAGLYERNLTNGVRLRPSREMVRGVASDIFFDARMVTEQLIDAWQAALSDRDYVRFLLRVSRSTRDRKLTDELKQLKMRTLIVWGCDDKVTPPEVAESFRSQISHAELHFIQNCGHAPNLEAPEEFTKVLQEFLPKCYPDNHSNRTRHEGNVASAVASRS